VKSVKTKKAWGKCTPPHTELSVYNPGERGKLGFRRKKRKKRVEERKKSSCAGTGLYYPRTFGGARQVRHRYENQREKKTSNNGLGRSKPVPQGIGDPESRQKG